MSYGVTGTPFHNIQEVMWGVSEHTEPLPLTPVVTMVLTLYKLAISVSTVTRTFLEVDIYTTDALLSHTHNTTPTWDLPGACADTIAQCNHLPVSVLGLLKSSETGKGLATEVQAYSKLMTKAGKILNQLIKKGVQFPMR
jgi:hypothetical protein